MSAGVHAFPHTVAPVASVWCRQVDNEAESPGYTAIPDEFPARHEALESIRVVGHLTINVADTQDYWDPDPSQTLSFYPNLFLYPAAGGRYTCVGRMFLSTEDRPRLGMKTLVFSTEELVASGEFGSTVLRAHATMVGRTEPRRPIAPPDSAVYQAAGEGFLFHRGATDPVVLVASDQWEAVSQAVADLVRGMPTSLVALSAFLVFPYFLPAPKVNLREFSEQVPLALAVMRVPRQEAEGDRHAKRMQSWQAQPVSLRDLTRPPSSRGKDSLPLVLQYIRDHADDKANEVVRRVDQVEGPRLAAALADSEAATGRERRKEMWRIGTAMETAAMLLARPRGRTVTATGEMAKRANEYLEARPGESPLLPPAPTPPVEAANGAPMVAPPTPAVVPATPSSTHPPAPVPAVLPVPSAPPPSPAPPVAPRAGAPLPRWLHASTEVALPANEPKSPPVPTADDPSLLVKATSPPVVAGSAPAARPLVPTSPVVTLPPLAPVPVAGPKPVDRAPGVVPSTAERGLLDARLSLAVRDLERRWNLTLDARLREAAEASERAAGAVRADLAARLAELERRPTQAAAALGPEVEAQIAEKVDPKVAEIEARLSQAVHATAEGWAERFRRDLKEATEELTARAAKSEEDLRAALVAQLDVELLEAKEQGTTLKEEVDAEVRQVVDGKLADSDQRRTKEMRELEQRVGILVDGRTKDFEEHLSASLATETQRLGALADDRLAHVERRLAVERDARLAEINEAQRAALAALQVRMQSFVEQMVRENQSAEQEKYVELLARLKATLEESIARSLGSPEFGARLNGSIALAVDGVYAERTAVLEKTIADAEERMRVEGEATLARLADVERQLGGREGELAAVEARLREELSDVDRRVMVVNDHVLPIVRQTWLKLAENEANVRAKANEAALHAMRGELLAELRKAEEEVNRQVADLRERLETSVQSHGRIWLNFLRQYGPANEGFPAPASPASHRVPRRLRPATPGAASVPPAATPLPPAPDQPPFASDPPNPMDPELAGESSPKETRRKPRKAP